MSQLVISNNSAANPQSLVLDAYMDVQDGDGMDLADPAFTQKVWSHSLLKPGATLSLEQFVEKELVFPLLLGPIGGQNLSTISAVLQFIQSINSIVTTPGATATWQPLGASQATTFDLLSGQADVDYSYRKEGQNWTQVTLRLFTAPLGRTAAPRLYATASGVGPLLMISPYASGGGQVIGASTQAGTAGYGGVKSGGVPSSGVFYWGSPSLAGDAPAQLQISYQAPCAPNATQVGRIPYLAMSVLPDQNYAPLITAAELANAHTLLPMTGAVGSQYLRSVASSAVAASANAFYSFGRSDPLPNTALPTNWAGFHRIFGIARASTLPQALTLFANAAVPQNTTATVYPGDWQVIDLGVTTIRASQSYQMIATNLAWTSPFPASNSVVADVTACVMLPDNSTWFFNPTIFGTPSIAASYVGTALLQQSQITIDDVAGEQFLSQAGGSLPPAPHGAGTNDFPRITQYTRGLVPTPDPKNGMPIIAFLGVGQYNTPSTIFSASSAWANSQNLPAYAQVNVLERFRYVSS